MLHHDFQLFWCSSKSFTCLFHNVHHNFKLTTISNEPYWNFGKNDKMVAGPKFAAPSINPQGAKKNDGIVSTTNKATIAGFPVIRNNFINLSAIDIISNTMYLISQTWKRYNHVFVVISETGNNLASTLLYENFHSVCNMIIQKFNSTVTWSIKISGKTMSWQLLKCSLQKNINIKSESQT